MIYFDNANKITPLTKLLKDRVRNYGVQVTNYFDLLDDEQISETLLEGYWDIYKFGEQTEIARLAHTRLFLVAMMLMAEA